MAPEVILKLLLHKVGRAMEEDGVAAAGGLLTDWLGRLCTAYRSNMSPDVSPSMSAAELMKVEPRLGAIARYVYGMVHSALVRAGDTSMDWRVFKRLLWSRLDPMELSTAVYPTLTPYVSATRVSA